MALKEFQAAVERMTGRSIDYLCDTPLDELRRDEEKRRGRPLNFVTAWPWAGRGNVLKDCLRSREDVEAAFDDAIQQLPDTP